MADRCGVDAEEVRCELGEHAQAAALVDTVNRGDNARSGAHEAQQARAEVGIKRVAVEKVGTKLAQDLMGAKQSANEAERRFAHA